jgi:crossover junction endodeoxyribonuclease RuvC
MRKVLSIDPGTSRLGYAILVENGNDDVVVKECGCIESTKNDSQETKLLKIHKKLLKLIDQYQPEMVAVEDLFFSKNAKTAISVGQAQGVVLLAAAKNELPTKMINPMHIKETLTGYGRAGKEQVQRMVVRLLDLDEMPTPDDTADAIACGLTFLKTNYSLK